MFSKFISFSVLLLVLSAPIGISAQTPAKTPEERALLRTDSMKTSLGLSDEQYQQVYLINLDFAQKADPILKSNDSKIAKLKQLKPLDKKRDDGLKTILNKEQFDSYKKKKKENRSKAKEAYKNNRQK